MRILLHGGGFVNKGAEAMVQVAQNELAERIPGAEFRLILEPHDATVAQAKGLTTMSLRPTSPVWELRHLAARIVRRVLNLHPAVVLSQTGPGVRRAVASADAIVDVSGFAVGDTWGKHSATRPLWLAEAISSNGGVIILLPQAWGPFTSPLLRANVLRLVNIASLVFARDAESLAHLEELIGVRDSVQRAADIAFLFRGESPDLGQCALEELLTMSYAKPTIGLVPNMQVYRRSAGVGESNAYVQIMAATARHCVDKLDTRVVVLPHEIKSAITRSPDDRFLCELVAKQAQRPGLVAPILGEHTPEHLKAIIGQFELLIGSRFHSLIAAVSQEVPAIALGWSHKYEELMNDVGLGAYAISYSRLDANQWLALVDTAWKSRAQNRDVLSKTIPLQKASAVRAFDKAAEVILEHHRCHQDQQ